jgi:hypothetical protein
MKVETNLDGAVVSAIERHYKHAKEEGAECGSTR